MISTRSTAEDGIELMSTTPAPLTGVGRRPSMRTRLRFEPSWRRLTVEAPSVLLALACTSPAVNRESAGENCGQLVEVGFQVDGRALLQQLESTVTIGLVAV